MPRIPESELEQLKLSVSMVRLVEAADSDEAGHPFRRKPAGDSDGCRPPLPEGDAGFGDYRVGLAGSVKFGAFLRRMESPLRAMR
jgi:hypothetical protein